MVRIENLELLELECDLAFGCGELLTERVAIGFAAPGVHWKKSVWFTLPNAWSDGPYGFEVDGQDVLDAMLEAVHDGLGGQITIWHTHIGSVEPSTHDIDALPAWAAQGIVYHVPSKTSTRYFHGFVIPNKARPRIGLAT